MATFDDIQSEMASAAAAAPVQEVPKKQGGSEYVPTYDELFPALKQSDTSQATMASGAWGARPIQPIKPSTITQVFHVPMVEQRIKGGAEAAAAKQADMVRDVMKKTGAQVEMTVSKDHTLSLVVSGKQDQVSKAKKLLLNKFQTEVTLEMSIPKDHHRFILGKNGDKLNKLVDATATRISVPKASSDSDIITVIGSRENVDKARLEIQLISDERAELAIERMPIEKAYHPFITGAGGDTLRNILSGRTCKVHIPPPSVDKDEVVVSGKKEDVAVVALAIKAIYDDKKANTRTMTAEVKKEQHKWVIGPRGNSIQQILRENNVTVTVPPADDPSTAVLLRGYERDLPQALMAVFAKANSIVQREVAAPEWIHRRLIGKGGDRVKKFEKDHPDVQIKFVKADERECVDLQGPPEAVEAARSSLQATVDEILATTAQAHVTIPREFHRFIIGKAGGNIQKLKDQYSVEFNIPADADESDVIVIEGDRAGVVKAKAELEEQGKKLADVRTVEVKVPQRFHKTLIGQNGKNIKQLMDQFKTVRIDFPHTANKSDAVSIKGDKKEVEACAKHVTKLAKELIETNHELQVPIFAKYHRHVIGRGGANIRKIRDECNVRVNVPDESTHADNIVVIGTKEGTKAAYDRLMAIQADQADLDTQTLTVPNKLHKFVRGKDMSVLKSIQSECGNVMIKLPPVSAKGDDADKITVRGPRDDVAKAVVQINELVKAGEASSFTEDIEVAQQHHRALVGRGGSMAKRIREETGARVVVPNKDTVDATTVTVVGTKEGVKKAAEQIRKFVKELESISTDEVEIDAKWHRDFVFARGRVAPIREISEAYPSVRIELPKKDGPEEKANMVHLRGPTELVKEVRERLLEQVHVFENTVTVTVTVAKEHHRWVIGRGGANVQRLTEDFKVQIKLPDSGDRRRGGKGGKAAPAAATESAEESAPESSSPAVEGEEQPSSSPSSEDEIRITGLSENCEMAKEALLELVPTVEEVPVPYDYHRFIIGAKGKGVKKFMTDFNCSVDFPSGEEKSDVVTVKGTKDAVAKGKEYLAERVKELDAEQADKEARGFTIEVPVKLEYHRAIIGPKGATISKIKEETDTRITVPKKGAENEDIITVQGYEKNAKEAEERLLKIVRDIEAQVTVDVEVPAEMHRRIIGQRGAGIRQIQKEYNNVQIKFPKDKNSPHVQIVGLPEDCEGCKAHLEKIVDDLQEEFEDMHIADAYRPPQYRQPFFGGDSPVKANGHRDNKQDFAVRDAPWPADSDAFPTMGGSGAAAPSALAGGQWGGNKKWGQ